MIIRIVRMTFRQNGVGQFLALFEARRELIRMFDGCHHLTLCRDADRYDVFFTISHWSSISHLEQYRASALFRETWRETKALFAARAEAWTLTNP